MTTSQGVRSGDLPVQQDALDALLRLSGGEPKRQDMLTKLAVFIARFEEAPSVTRAHVEAAALTAADSADDDPAADVIRPAAHERIQTSAMQRRDQPGGFAWAALAGLIAVLAGGGAWEMLHRPPSPTGRATSLASIPVAGKPASAPGAAPEPQPSKTAPKPLPEVAVPEVTPLPPQLATTRSPTPPSEPDMRPRTPPPAAPAPVRHAEREVHLPVQEADPPPPAPAAPAEAGTDGGTSYQAMVAELRRAARRPDVQPSRPSFAPPWPPSSSDPHERFFGSYVMGPDGRRTFVASP